MKTFNEINVRRLAFLLASVTLTACLSSTDVAPSSPSDPATETFASNLGINISQMTKTSLGDYYQDITVGTGTTLGTQLKVFVDYAGFLKDGSIFSSAATTRFSLDSTIVGFQDGMTGMKVGGERLIVIPSALGFGPSPNGPIPANSTLIFDVVLDSIP
jgi:FKBP-type peptidyl-prolyl cis-trans isomerase